MTVRLTRSAIDAALPRVAEGLHRYVHLQAQSHLGDLRANAAYRTQFNRFYRVRRDKAWQDQFYDLLERTKRRPTAFAAVLRALHRRTGRYEASFASKLLATVDPEMPVIDAVVLKNLGLRLPAYGAPQRAERLVALHPHADAERRHA
jgi:hypothetical protein